MNISDSESRLEVASSRIRMRGSARMARAMETRWRCPPLNFTPRSPMIVSYPSGKRSANSSTRAIRHAARISSSVARGREKATFSRPRATEEEILAACRIARVDEFAERFPEGYDTIIGERGVKLSGGQRQRVSIARAILADPRILILDEATSSLDSESEMLIQEGLAQLMRGRTTFVIAHRLSTIRRADQILVVEAGKVVERGTHASLYAAGGRYRELYDKQHGLESNLFLPLSEGEMPEAVDLNPTAAT